MINFLKAIIYIPLYNILVFLVWLVPGHSVGWAIIILTILIRLALLPSSMKAAKAQVKMQMLQPEINKIRKEIKDQQAQGKAIMDLYKREGSSPFGSCLPLLVQLPIIFVLYRVFYNVNKLGINTTDLYSFTPHLNSLNTYFLGLNLAKPELWVLPILAGATQFILSKMMMPNLPKSANGEPDMMQMANKQMIYFLPLITIFFARSLPAALALYWTVTTIFGIVQQYYVNKSLRSSKEIQAEVKQDEIETEKEIKEIKAEIKPNKKADFMTKMMNRRLDKQEKKTGVNISIRQKK